VKVDVLVSEPHFLDHTAPVYLALPPEMRGDFVLIRSRYAGPVDPQMMLARAASRGVIATYALPDEDRLTLVASFGDLKAARSLKRTRFANIEHGIGQSFVDTKHPSYAGGTGRADVSLFLTPNEHSARRWRQAYPGVKVAVVGCPKLDSLPGRGAGERPVVAISFHWGGGFPPETRSAFDDYKGQLADLAERYTVIGHGHPRYLPNLARFYKRLGIPVVPDFADVCRQTDLYVCDTNSTIFEFAHTGRPVLLLNKPGRQGYRKDIEHGLRFWEAAAVGVQCDSPKDLVDKVAEALADSPEQQAARQTALRIVYKYRSGAAQRAAAALTEWASSFSDKKVAA
jgi:hypothetical protein